MSYVQFDSNDIKRNAIPAALGCLLFPIPLIACPDSRFGRFCANQGLLLCIVYLVVRLAFWLVGLITGWIPLIGWLISFVGRLLRVCLVGVGLYEAFMAYQGKPQRLPIIGDYELIR